MLAVFGLALLLVGGCGGDDRLQDPVLVGIIPSAMLAPHIEASMQSLSEPDRGDPKVRLDLELYAALRQDIFIKDRRPAARESLIKLWQACPDHVLWPELAMRNLHLLRGFEDFQEIFSHPVCADSSSAISAYMLGWRERTMKARDTQWRLAYSRRDTLDPFPALWIELKMAFVERHSGQPELSVRIAVDMLPQARELGGWRLEAIVWTEIARAMLAGAELDDALYAAAMADTLAATAIPDGGAIANLLSIRELKADILAARRDVQSSLALYFANIDAAANLKLAYLESRNLNRASMLASTVGDLDTSLELCRRGVILAISDGDSLNVPRHLMNAARRFLQRGDLDSCLVYQKQAVQWVEVYPHPKNVARMPLMQAEYYAYKGDFAVVDSLLRSAASLGPDTDTIAGRAEFHLELIRGWMEADRPDLVYRSIKAIEDLQTDFGDALADRHVSADIGLLIGEFLSRRGEYNRASETLDMAAAALEQRPDTRRLWVLARNRGIVARESSDLSAAEVAFRACVGYGQELGDPELESSGRLLLASVLLAAGRHTEARAVLPNTDSTAFKGRFTTRVSALLLTGISHAKDENLDLALDSFTEARRSCRSWSPPDLTARIDLETGRALADAGRFSAASKLYHEVAANLVDRDEDKTLRDLADFNGDLRRDLIEAVISLPTAEPSTTLRLAREVLPRWRVATPAMDEDPTLFQIIFFVGEHISGRWIVNGGNVNWAPLPGARGLSDLLAPVLTDMATPGRPVDQGAVQRLADTLLIEVVDTWADGQTLAIVPDQVLFGVPWAALPLPGEREMLIDHGPLAILDQPAVVSKNIRIHQPGGRLLVIGADGGSDVVGFGLPVLRHAEREAREVAAVWPADMATLRTGDATATALTPDADLSSFEVIHLASHATVFNRRSERSMLLVAVEGREALTATDIRKLGLAAELVFLSCCEAGDGANTHLNYAGLARSFIDAGAQNIVASLAPIDDEAARVFAGRFYIHWLAGLSVPSALRSAQRDFRDGDSQWSHPFYWGFYQAMVAQTPAAKR